MNPVGIEEEFGKYELIVKVHNQNTYQLVQDSRTGEETWQKWGRKRHLGHGAFGEVWQEEWQDSNGDWHYRAIKTCSEGKMRVARIDYKRELSALAAFSKSECAAWFVNLHGWWMDSGNLAVAMEYLGQGDLSRYIPDGVPDLEIREIAEDLLRGLEFMHKEGFAHRDIKPQNILVSQKRPLYPRWWVKIADFGISKQVRADFATDFHTSVGTPSYCAPEVLGILKQSREVSVYSSKVDMWSLGCVLFSLGSKGQLAFSDSDLVRYCDGNVPFNPDGHLLHLSDEGKLLLMVLLQAQPDHRPSATEALRCSWLAISQVSPPSSITATLSPQAPTDGQNLNTIRSTTIPAPSISISGSHDEQNYNSFLNTVVPMTLTVSSSADARPESNSISNVTKAMKPRMETAHITNATVTQKKSTTQFPGVADTKQQESDDQKLVHPRRPSLPEDASAPLRQGSPTMNNVEDSRSGSNEPIRQQSASVRMKHEREIGISRSVKWKEKPDEEVEACTGGDGGIPSNIIGPWRPERALTPDEAAQLKEWSNRNHHSKDIHDSRTPLFMAVAAHDQNIAELLLLGGANVNAQNENYSTALLEAAFAGQLEMCQMLIHHGADDEARDIDDHSVLLNACRSSDGFALVKWLVLERMCSIDIADNTGRTGLFYAVIRHDLEVSKWLVKHGANVRVKNIFRAGPLHEVIRSHTRGNLDLSRKWDMTEWLVRQGADLNGRDDHGETPLLLMFSGLDQPSFTTIMIMVARGADVTVTTIHGQTMLHLAIQVGSSLERIEWLAAKGVDLKARTPEGRTLLHLAIHERRLEVVKWLVEGDQGADIDTKDNYGVTPRGLALTLKRNSADPRDRYCSDWFDMYERSRTNVFSRLKSRNWGKLGRV